MRGQQTAGLVRISAGAFLPQGRKYVPQVSLMSLKCRDNWSTWLSKHEKSAGAARISVGAFLAPGLKICPSSVPRVPQAILIYKAK